MIIRVATNVEEVSGVVRDLFRDQLPFALSRAIRKTALEVQEAQREHQRNTFTIRRATFVNRAVKIRPFPTKQSPEAIVRIEPPGGPERADVLTRHEEGGKVPPPPGRQARAVEREVRPTRTAIAPRQLRPKRLGLRPSQTSTSTRIELGVRRTFMIRRPDGSGAIFQRTGKGSFGDFTGTRVLWAFSPDGVTLRPRLQFFPNAERLVQARWEENMAEAWDRAVETAR